MAQRAQGEAGRRCLLACEERVLPRRDVVDRVGHGWDDTDSL